MGGALRKGLAVHGVTATAVPEASSPKVALPVATAGPEASLQKGPLPVATAGPEASPPKVALPVATSASVSTPVTSSHASVPTTVEAPPVHDPPESIQAECLGDMD